MGLRLVRQRPFSQADVHVIQREPALIASSAVTKLGASELQPYVETQATPANWDETWVNPGSTIAPGGLLYEKNLGFPAHAVLVDNLTSQWLQVEPGQRAIAPYTFGWCLPASSASQIARVRLKTPPGLNNFPSVIGEQAWVGFSEAYLPPQTGAGIPAQLIVAGFGGLNTGVDAGLPPGAVPIEAGSGSVANAAAVATLAGVANKTTYITGFEVTSDGATGVLVVRVTVGPLSNGAGGAITEGYTYTFLAGATSQDLTLTVSFTRGVPASGPNTAIAVTLPAGGLGNTSAEVNAHGYQL